MDKKRRYCPDCLVETEYDETREAYLCRNCRDYFDIRVTLSVKQVGRREKTGNNGLEMIMKGGGK